MTFLIHIEKKVSYEFIKNLIQWQKKRLEALFSQK
jgi:hypothetical protein